MVKYRPENDIPQFARQLKTLSPTKLSEFLTRKRNEEISPDSVRMWLTRNPSIRDEINKEIIEGLPSIKKQVSKAVFDRQAFSELGSVKEWALDMNARQLDQETVIRAVGTMRQICMGSFPKLHLDFVQEGKWVYKHPDAFSYVDAREMLSLLRDKGADPSGYAKAMKDFLKSSKDPSYGKIVVGKPRGFKKLARLYVDRATLDKMLEWIAGQNYEVYILDRFMFMTGTRLSASLEILVENVNLEGGYVTVFDKARRSMFPMGKDWIKQLSPSLVRDFTNLMAGRKAGRLFGIKEHDVEKLNREVLRRFVPDLEPKIRMPSHFWRHMFFQHMLRATDWNYPVCAELGGSTVSSLEESYGRPPEEQVKRWGIKYAPTLESVTYDLDRWSKEEEAKPL